MTAITMRPLFRWKLFWLGAFTLCFLGWAWRDSYHATIYGAWAGKWPLQVYRFDGAGILISGPSTTPIADGSRWTIGREAASKPLRLEEYLEGRSAYGVRYWKLPDAVVFYPLLGLWGAGLVWRRRRHLRLASEMKCLRASTACRAHFLDGGMSIFRHFRIITTTLNHDHEQ